MAPPLAPHRPTLLPPPWPRARAAAAACAGEEGGISSRPLLAARLPLPPPRVQAVVQATARRPLAPSPAHARPLARGRRSRRRARRMPHGPPRPAAPRLRPYSGAPGRRTSALPRFRAAAPPPHRHPLPRAGRAPRRPSHRPSSSSPATPPLSRRALLPNSPALRPCPCRSARAGELWLKKNLTNGARTSLSGGSEAAVVFSSLQNIRTHIRPDSGPKHVEDV